MSMRSALPGLVLALLLEAGCAEQDAAQLAYEDTQAKTANLVDQARRPLPVAELEGVIFDSTPWYGDTGVLMDRNAVSPRMAQHKPFITPVGHPETLPEVVRDLEALFQVPIELDPDTAEVIAPIDAGAIAPLHGGAPVPRSGALPPPPLPPGGAAIAPPAEGLAAGAGGGGFTYNLDGTLAGDLDFITARYGLSYSYDPQKDRIRIYRFVRRTFTIVAQDVAETVSTTISSGSASGAGSAGTTAGAGVPGATGSAASGQGAGDQTSKKTTSLRLWDDLRKAIDDMLPKESGAHASYVPSSGIVTVVAPKGVMEEVSRYIRDLNDRLDRQVVIDVRTYTVNDDKVDDIAFDPSIIFSELAKNFTISATGPITAVDPNAGSLAFAVLQQPTSSGFKQFSSSQVLFKALNSIGKTYETIDTPLVAANNTSTPYVNVTNTTFLAAVATTQTLQSTSTSLTPGVVTTGLNLSATPRILSDGRVRLHFALSFSQLLSLQTFTSGTQQVQQPNTSQQATDLTVTVLSGETILLAGFNSDKDTVTRNGIGSAYNQTLGGEANAQRTRTMTVVALTPAILAKHYGSRYAQRSEELPPPATLREN